MSHKRYGRSGQFWWGLRDGSSKFQLFWFDPQRRQTRHASLGTSNPGEAELRFAEEVVKRSRPHQQEADAALLEAVLIRYMTKEGKKKRSADQMRRSLAYWSEFFAEATIAEITPDRQEEFVEWLSSHAKRRASPSYIRRILSDGRTALNWAVKKQHIKAAPFIDLSLAAEGQGRNRVLALDEAATLFKAAAALKEARHAFTYLVLAFGTAARPEALVELHNNPKQIDFDEGWVKLNPEGRKQTKKFRPSIPLAPSVAAYLRTLQRPGYCIEWRGRPVTGAAMNTMMKRLCKAAGLSSDIIAYTARHTMTTLMQEEGVLDPEIDLWIGHVSQHKVLRAYKHGIPPLPNCVAATEKFFEEMRARGVPFRGIVARQAVELRSNCVPVGGGVMVQVIEDMVLPERIELSHQRQKSL